MNSKKVVLIGCGSVGSSFLYSALNQNLFNSYILIDAFEDLAKGNKLDFEDANAILAYPAVEIKHGTYDDCRDADIVVITAGAPQLPGETRLDLIDKNAKIIKDIATNIKNSGFNGITIIASNPVDIIGKLYQKFTNFNENKVIPSGTILDSARLRAEISKITNVNPNAIQAYVVGEHGDSSVSVFSQISISGAKLEDFKKLTEIQKSEIHNYVMKKAYEIIKAKKATYYGIGACLSRICKAILNDENTILPVSVILDNSKEMYVGWPAIINKNGWNNPIKLELSNLEQESFEKSVDVLKKYYDSVISNLDK